MNVNIDMKKLGAGLLAATGDLSRWYLRAVAVTLGAITALQVTGVIVLY